MVWQCGRKEIKKLIFVFFAKTGHLPAAISLININCLTPIPSLIFMCILTIILLFIRDVYVLINYVSFVEALFTLMSVSGLLWLRKKQPDANRPIKVNSIIPIIYLLTCGFLVISSCYKSALEVGVGTAIIVSGIPVYYATIHRPIGFLTNTSQKINMFCAKFFVCVPNQEKFDWYLLSVPSNTYDDKFPFFNKIFCHKFYWLWELSMNLKFLYCDFYI